MLLILYYFLSAFTGLISDHAIYLSTINVDLDERVISAEIKVFEDDLRDALRADFGAPIDTASYDFLENAFTYFDKHVKIEINKERVDFNPVTIQRVGESYHFIMKSDIIKPISLLTFDVDYFLELFPVQQNVLHVKSGDEQWFHIFKKGKQKYSLKINL